MSPISDSLEWIEADGLGGFASGTATGVRTRRYHAWLLTATSPPTGRLALVNGAEIEVRTGHGAWPLSAHLYAPGVRHPGGDRFLRSFATEPWPIWQFELPDGLGIRQELFVCRESGEVVVRWTALNASDDVELMVRPLFSGRNYHSTHHENSAFRFEPRTAGRQWIWSPYPGVPETGILANGEYTHSPCWYRQFLYALELERGLDALEDLASPGEFRFTLATEPAVMILQCCDGTPTAAHEQRQPGEMARALESEQRRRRSAFRSRFERAADAYVVRRGQGRTVIAGYPWFTDWGRDTLIALRGLCLATGRLDDAERILLAWSETVSEGMLPNRFPDQGEAAEYNSVDAALWYVIVVDEFLSAARTAQRTVSGETVRRLDAAVEAILEGYCGGTRFGIRADSDGLLRCGTPQSQLTWMDVKIDDWAVTPRCGKPVEVNALWLNALALSAQKSPRWRELCEGGRTSFAAKFWDAGAQCLCDVVDVDHVADRRDTSLRPNQIFAVGGLPLVLLDEARASDVLNAVETQLLTPVGLRSLSPRDSQYVGQYVGEPHRRDRGYHQGTVWPWLLGPFVEAWLRVHGDSNATRRTARERFFEPLVAGTRALETGHVCEIADGDAPHAARGCPFQAWSLGELLRIDRMLRPLVSQSPASRPRRG